GININEYGMDATYNTNNMGFELYVLHAEVNGTGFPLSYLQYFLKIMVDVKKKYEQKNCKCSLLFLKIKECNLYFF
ncbi:hypothetical protein C1646_627764, partial [Rhizophagus diaphanus]